LRRIFALAPNLVIACRERNGGVLFVNHRDLALAHLQIQSRLTLIEAGPFRLADAMAVARVFPVGQNGVAQTIETLRKGRNLLDHYVSVTKLLQSSFHLA
jgi:hypothetical protein